MAQERRASARIFIFLTILSIVVVFQKDIFAIYNIYSIYIIGLFVFTGIIVDRRVEKKKLLYIVFLAVYFVFALQINNGGIGSALTFIVPVIMLFALDGAKFTEKHERIIRRTCIIAMIFLFFESFVYASDWVYFRFNAINPNTMGMYTEFSIMTWLALTDIKKTRKVVALAQISMAFISLWNYAARAGIVIVMLYILCLLVPQRMRSRKTVISLVAIIMVFGLLFPFVYLLLYHSGIQYEIMGKSLFTGRELIWESMIEKFTGNWTGWMFGLGSRVTFWNDQYTNVHNNYFAVIVDFGIVGFVLYYGMILRQIFSVKSYRNRKIYKLMMLFICYTLVLGITEVTTLFSTIYPLAFFGLGWAKSIYNNIERETNG